MAHQKRKKKLPPETLVQKFARNLLQWRTDNEVTQAAVATATNLSTSYISMLERGQRSPPFTTIEALAKLFRRDPVEFFK